MRAILLVWSCAWIGCGGGSAGSGQPPPADKPAPPAAPGSRIQSVYSIDLDKAIDDRARAIRRDLEVHLAELKLGATVQVPMAPAGTLRVTPSDAAAKTPVELLVKASYGDVLDSRACEADAGPTASCFAITARYAAALKEAALRLAVETIRARLAAAKVADPTVVARGEQIVVELPATDPEASEIRSLIRRTGKLELVVVDNGSDFMKRVYAHVGSTGPNNTPSDPLALQAGIVAEVETWRSEDGGAMQADYYLTARDRGQFSGRRILSEYLKQLAATDPARFKLPDDREIGYELVEPLPGAKDGRPYWRTYYLERDAALTGAAIANATGTYDPNTNRPMVLLDFTRAGGQSFGELTARIVGKKLATVLDGTVKSAPIINGPIRGGRASITMGGGDVRAQETQRDELVTVLKSGALPAPLREESSARVP